MRQAVVRFALLMVKLCKYERNKWALRIDWWIDFAARMNGGERQ